MRTMTEWMDRTLFPDYGRNWDDLLFREEILRHIGKARKVLDVGAGAGIVPQMNFHGLAGMICGIDPDPRVVSNPFLDEGKTGVGEDIPYPDSTFDLVFADNVLEHLANPTAVFREVLRVLKPGGMFLAKTPNSWHYVPLIARLTPHSFHQFVTRGRGRAAEDTFPTLYRANTPRQIERIAADAGLKLVNTLLVEGRPEYLRFSPLTYAMGYFYERLVTLVPGLWRFRVLLILRLQKPLAP